MTTRNALIALGFLAAIGATGALTLQAQTKEAGVAENTCGVADWPYIPARCLDGAPSRSVRMVSTEADMFSPDARPVSATQ